MAFFGRMASVMACVLAILAAVSSARADGMLLVHGYFSGVTTWEKNGVLAELERGGWRQGGVFTATPAGVTRRLDGAEPPGLAWYLADLPSEAPIPLQARLLVEMMTAVAERHPGQRLVLVGHSAGGVVARMAMVQNPKIAVDTLITIASPHLGTDKAEIAGLLASTPLAMVTPMFSGADTLNRSGQLYADLVRERPGSLLYWLNRQPHPEGRYVGVVREAGFALWGDNTVPSWSQDLGNVAVLKGRSRAIRSGSEHQLEAADGQVILDVLKP